MNTWLLLLPLALLSLALTAVIRRYALARSLMDVPNERSSHKVPTPRGGGVARRSLHMDGRAIDIRLAGVPLTGLRDAALSLSLGGVGFYPREQFVHLDTGRVRSW